MAFTPDRHHALALWHKYSGDAALLRHALAVEGVMRHFALLLDEDPEKWGVVGILHDIDYEKWPDAHCQKARELLEGESIPEEYIRAVVSHGYGICSDVEPVHVMEKVLFTIDELTGLIGAAALMRPSKSVMDIELKSVKKKFKDKHFAAGVDRSVIERGCLMLDMTLDYVIEQTIAGMRDVSDAIGLGLKSDN